MFFFFLLVAVYQSVVREHKCRAPARETKLSLWSISHFFREFNFHRLTINTRARTLHQLNWAKIGTGGNGCEAHNISRGMRTWNRASR